MYDHTNNPIKIAYESQCSKEELMDEWVNCNNTRYLFWLIPKFQNSSVKQVMESKIFLLFSNLESSGDKNILEEILNLVSYNNYNEIVVRSNELYNQTSNQDIKNICMFLCYISRFNNLYEENIGGCLSNLINTDPSVIKSIIDSSAISYLYDYFN